VFGDPARTGKPTLDDLREGKATVLMAHAVRSASPAQLEVLREHVGDPDLTEQQAVEIREILESTGARQAVETLIEERRDMALHALDVAPFTPEAAACLRDVARTATVRQV
jgi:geranylgeranyl diphosphate synthase, type I